MRFSELSTFLIKTSSVFPIYALAWWCNVFQTWLVKKNGILGHIKELQKGDLSAPTYELGKQKEMMTKCCLKNRAGCLLHDVADTKMSHG